MSYFGKMGVYALGIFTVTSIGMGIADYIHQRNDQGRQMSLVVQNITPNYAISHVITSKIGYDIRAQDGTVVNIPNNVWSEGIHEGVTLDMVVTESLKVPFFDTQIKAKSVEIR